MASPFSFFRRRQRTLLAVFGVLLMVAFVVGSDEILSIVGVRSRGEVDETIAQSDYGKFTLAECRALADRRNALKDFLSALLSQRIDAGRMDPARAQEMMSMRWQIVQIASQLIEQLVPGQSTHRAVIEESVLAARADDLGIVITDQAIAQFLRETADAVGSAMNSAAVTDSDFQNALMVASAKSGMRVTKVSIYDAMRVALAARELRRGFDWPQPPVTPAQSWEDLWKSRLKATVEYAALSGEDEARKIADPPSADLEKFFNQHKDREAQPGSPEPGFKLPRLVAVGYFHAEHAKFFHPDRVTDEEIGKYYTEHPGEFPFRRPLGGEWEKEPAPPKSGEEPPKADTPMPSAAEPEAKTPAEKQPAGAEKPPVATPPAATPADTPPSATPPASAPKDEEARDAAEETSDCQATTESPEKPAEPATPATPDNGPTALPPASPPPPLGTKYVLPKADVRETPDPDAEPLWRVRDQIRDILAEQQATKAMNDAFAGVRPLLRTQRAEISRWKVEHDRNPQFARPKEPDFEAAAKQAGLVFGSRGLASSYELQHDDQLGKLTGTSSTGQPGGNLVSQLFGHRDLYVEAEYTGDKDRYLAWKSEDQEAKVPALADPWRDPAEKLTVRDEAIRVWKLMQAREKIRARASELLAEAQKARKPLTELFANRPEVKLGTTPPFSWLSGDFDANFRGMNNWHTSEAGDVVDPGDAFMAAVFGLQEPGDVALAFNQPQTMCYVVRLTKAFEPTRETLQAELLRPGSRQQADVVSQEAYGKEYRGWVEEQLAAAGLKWTHEPADEAGR